MRYILALVCVVSVIAAGFAIRAGRALETPEGFQRMVSREVPGLYFAGTLERAELLLAWAANTADYAADAKSVRGDTEPMPPRQAYTEVFAPNAGGVYCGGQSVFYKNVLHLFGIDAFTINFGTLEHDLTHVSVVVPHEGKFYLFDPTFAAMYWADGGPVPIGRLLAGDLQGVEVRELSLADRDYLLSVPDHPFCRTEPTKAGAFYACGIGEASFLDHYLTGWAHLLEKAGLPVGIGTLPALMREGFFSVGPALNPETRERFLQLLAEYDIPMK